ncbi:MAG: hypothetical protein A2381_00075 [Bdellovibrionales bacterium RIFOXYB1_FULL_37_110]|nr:MAG: hypothetical protein A2181_06085 [Bdellovibrionales bacterium RIFOXYA1_FULL_38_20]OFZ49282.1 MAG: hypothetical protein A2417_17260 [Bdellovibrionales bacterium RIFOXYC1_FULL_37_79]OFZ57743.1 MAG: hypothetical protein A2381_00075 [Bdellovibrionales bacterium RIFOXYB1_FULL_37_110]OFZ61543.1 MAG: hypothetical protein A2577_00540 [Bdellovibrionales bacterium RIFOXYD1_FULL_36_51]
MKLFITAFLIFSSLLINTSFAETYRYKCTSSAGNYVDITFNNNPRRLDNLDIFLNGVLHNNQKPTYFTLAGGMPDLAIDNFDPENTNVKFQFIMGLYLEAKVYVNDQEVSLTCKQLGGQAPSNGPVF